MVQAPVSRQVKHPIKKPGIKNDAPGSKNKKSPDRLAAAKDQKKGNKCNPGQKGKVGGWESDVRHDTAEKNGDDESDNFYARMMRH